LSSRGQGLIPAPPAVIFSIVFDVKRLPQWDGMIDKATVVQQFDSDLILLHILLKGFDFSADAFSLVPLSSIP